MGEKKRKREKAEDEVSSENIPEKTSRKESSPVSVLREHVLSLKLGEHLDLDVLRSFTLHLISCKDDLESYGEEVRAACDLQVLSALLINYSAFRTEKDLIIFDALMLLESVYGVKMSQLGPLVCGEGARDNYDKLRTLGMALHVKLTQDQVISTLDKGLMWKTVLHGTREENKWLDQTYDFRYLLRVFAWALQPGSEMSCRLFVSSNCLAVCFAACASKERATRSLAYFCLQKYLQKLQELDLEHFAEKPFMVYLLRLFKQSIEHDVPRLSHLMTHFLARCSKLLLSPTDTMYPAICSFLTLKPQMELNQVPELYKLLFSSSTESHERERCWLLQFIAEAICEPFDYAVLQNRSGVKLLLSSFASVLVDFTSRRWILQCLKACVSLPSVAHDLFCRMNLHSWIALTIQRSDVCRWEALYLAEIFSLLVSNEREWGRERGAGVNGEVNQRMARIASRPVLSVLRAGEEQKVASLTAAIEQVLDKKWKPKKKEDTQPFQHKTIKA